MAYEHKPVMRAPGGASFYQDLSAIKQQKQSLIDIEVQRARIRAAAKEGGEVAPKASPALELPDVTASGVPLKRKTSEAIRGIGASQDIHDLSAELGIPPDKVQALLLKVGAAPAPHSPGLKTAVEIAVGNEPILPPEAQVRSVTFRNKREQSERDYEEALEKAQRILQEKEAAKARESKAAPKFALSNRS